MIVDNTLVFSDSQAITADAGSTNVIDIGAAGTAFGHASALARDIGKGNEIPVLVTVTETFDALTSLNIKVQSDDNAAFSSAKTIAQSGEILLAALVAGYKFTFPAEMPEGSDERYLRLYYDITGTGPSVGKIFAAIVAGRQTNP
jgi:hypothetical protein